MKISTSAHAQRSQINFFLNIAKATDSDIQNPQCFGNNAIPNYLQFSKIILRSVQDVSPSQNYCHVKFSLCNTNPSQLECTSSMRWQSLHGCYRSCSHISRLQSFLRSISLQGCEVRQCLSRRYSKWLMGSQPSARGGERSQIDDTVIRIGNHYSDLYAPELEKSIPHFSQRRRALKIIRILCLIVA